MKAFWSRVQRLLIFFLKLLKVQSQRPDSLELAVFKGDMKPWRKDSMKNMGALEWHLNSHNQVSHIVRISYGVS